MDWAEVQAHYELQNENSAILFELKNERARRQVEMMRDEYPDDE